MVTTSGACDNPMFGCCVCRPALRTVLYSSLQLSSIHCLYLTVTQYMLDVAHKTKLKTYSKQEAQLPQRDSASATHVFLGSLTDRACTSLSTASVLQLYNRLAKLVSTISANKPCDIHTLSWIGHSRSFKVILIGAGRNPEWSVVVTCN